MAFVWSAINVGDEVEYSPNIQIDELHDNADSIYDTLANVADDITVAATYNIGVDAAQNVSYDGAFNGVDNGADNPLNVGANNFKN